MLNGKNADVRLRTRKLSIPVEGRKLRDGQAISPDGNKIAYVAHDKLWIRHLDRTEPREVPESDDAEQPFWSPDSDVVGYGARGSLWKVGLEEGVPVKICELPLAELSGASWSETGDIVVGVRHSGQSSELYRVSAVGGELEPFIRAAPEKDLRDFSLPHVLPEGKGLLAVVVTSNGSEVMAGVGADWRSVSSTSGDDRSAPVYSPSGHVLYVREQGGSAHLWAVPFSLEMMAATGDSVLVATDAQAPSVSRNGDLLFSSPIPDDNQVVWVDRNGIVHGTIVEAEETIVDPALSADASKLFVYEGGQEGSIYDLVRGGRVSIPGFTATWAPSGDTVFFITNPDADLLSMPSDASEAPEGIITGERVVFGPDVSRDGNYLAYYDVDPETGRDLWYLPLEEGSEPTVFLATPAEETLPQISPEGRFIAYQSNTSGRWEVYVRPFPEGDGRSQVSVDGGVTPRWSPQGDEIFYVADNALMAVPVETEPGFVAGAPKMLFRGDDVGTDLLAVVIQNRRLYDVAPDGERFVVVQGAGQGTSEMVLVENWFAEFQN